MCSRIIYTVEFILPEGKLFRHYLERILRYLYKLGFHLSHPYGHNITQEYTVLGLWTSPSIKKAWIMWIKILNSKYISEQKRVDHSLCCCWSELSSQICCWINGNRKPTKIIKIILCNISSMSKARPWYMYKLVR